MDRISVIGLGKLGCTMMACFAHKGWTVVGADVIQGTVDAVNDGRSPIYEPRVDEYIKAHKPLISATTDVKQAVLDTEISFIIVPTPSKPDGSFTSNYVETSARDIAVALKEKSKYHLVVVTSTVMPGETQRIGKMIEELSGKEMGVDFGVCYNPDFIALGRIVRDFLNPDMILIGQSDPAAGRRLEEIHELLTDSDPEINRMSIHNAELAKITLNAFCTLKITFANVVAEICERMPDGDASDVLNAVGADSRVGKKYFKGGLAFGGPCFGRDNRAFSHAAREFGVVKTLSPVTDEINDYQKGERLYNLVESNLREDRTISILGVTYKEDTTLVEESPVIPLIWNLVKTGVTVRVYDPAGLPAAREELAAIEDKVTWCDDMISCISGTQVCFVGVPWDEFRFLTKDVFLKNMKKKPLVIDTWGLYPFNGYDGVDCVKLGQNYEKISKATLRMMDESMTNLAEGRVGDPIDPDKLSEIG